MYFTSKFALLSAPTWLSIANAYSYILMQSCEHALTYTVKPSLQYMGTPPSIEWVILQLHIINDIIKEV